MIKTKIIAIAFMLASMNLISQTNSAHPTIGNVLVAYKSVPQGTASVSMMDIKCIPHATITLNPSSSPSKVYFKVINPQTSAVIYQVSYFLNSTPIVNNAGNTLFENSNGIITISTGQEVALHPYLYELQTESNQNVMSTVYSVTK